MLQLSLWRQHFQFNPPVATMTYVKVVYWTSKAWFSLKLIMGIIGLLLFWVAGNVTMCCKRNWQTETMRFGPSSVLSLALWSVSAHCCAVPSTQKAAEVRSQASVAVGTWDIGHWRAWPCRHGCTFAAYHDWSQRINGKSPCRARVCESSSNGVSSHYFPSPWGPTGAAMMDRYILQGITGMKKEKNTRTSFF